MNTPGLLDPAKQKWTILYPVYINAKKTTAEGRRIAKSKAVDNPSVQEIHDVCKYLGFQCEIEPEKAYPRDWMQKGRVRVQLKEENKPVKPEIPNRRALMLKLGELIPKLQTRQRGGTVSAGPAAGGKNPKRKKGR